MKKLIALALGAVIAAGAAADETERTMGMTVTIGGTDFSAVLDDNDAARNIAAMLPLALSMSEWAGNSEYYARFPGDIAAGNAARPSSFAAGDIALYNGRSLVIFYAATSQTAGYVKVGHIAGENLKDALDRAKGSVRLRADFPAGTGGKIGMTGLQKSDGKMTAGSEAEKIRALYERMYRAMIAKDMAEMAEIHGDEFVLVHMTGQRMDKGEYFAAVRDGTLNYYRADHDDISVSVDGARATLAGKSRVEAAVYGGARRTWRLRQDMTLEKIGGSWRFTQSTASAY